MPRPAKKQHPAPAKKLQPEPRTPAKGLQPDWADELVAELPALNSLPATAKFVRTARRYLKAGLLESLRPNRVDTETQRTIDREIHRIPRTSIAQFLRNAKKEAR